MIKVFSYPHTIHPSIHPSKYIHIGGWVALVGVAGSLWPLGNISVVGGWHRLYFY
jgi:hypothetical protein